MMQLNVIYITYNMQLPGHLANILVSGTDMIEDQKGGKKIVTSGPYPQRHGPQLCKA